MIKEMLFVHISYASTSFMVCFHTIVLFHEYFPLIRASCYAVVSSRFHIDILMSIYGTHGHIRIADDFFFMSDSTYDLFDNGEENNYF